MNSTTTCEVTSTGASTSESICVGPRGVSFHDWLFVNCVIIFMLSLVALSRLKPYDKF